MALTMIGKNETITTTVIAVPMPRPKTMIRIGAMATTGAVRSAITSGRIALLAAREEENNAARLVATTTATARPRAAFLSVSRTALPMSPRLSRRLAESLSRRRHDVGRHCESGHRRLPGKGNQHDEAGKPADPAHRPRQVRADRGDQRRCRRIGTDGGRAHAKLFPSQMARLGPSPPVSQRMTRRSASATRP